MPDVERVLELLHVRLVVLAMIEQEAHLLIPQVELRP